MKARRPYPERYEPGRRDKPHMVAQAEHMLRGRRSLDGLTPFQLECQWNLKPETARKLFEIEALRRARSGGAGAPVR